MMKKLFSLLIPVGFSALTACNYGSPEIADSDKSTKSDAVTESIQTT